jgi:amino acid permease
VLNGCVPEAALIAGRVHLSLDPIFCREVFSVPLIFSAIPIAALSYIGFDAISTLNEEAKGGGQAVSKATMIVLLAVAVMFVLQVYLAALFVPIGTKFSEDSAVTAFYDIADVAVGPWFKVVVTLVSALIAILANAIVSQATTSRLLFSMARDRQIPSFFAAVDRRRKIPVRAIVLVAALSTAIGIIALAVADSRYRHPHLCTLECITRGQGNFGGLAGRWGSYIWIAEDAGIGILSVRTTRPGHGAALELRLDDLALVPQAGNPEQT